MSGGGGGGLEALWIAARFLEEQEKQKLLRNQPVLSGE